MSKPFKDITSKRFGKLLVIKHTQTKDNRAYWMCICDCGNLTEVRGDMLRGGNIQSCGCLRKDNLTKAITKHGKSKSKLYKLYYGIIDRCYNKNNKQYHNYGGRGITVCDEWLNNFMSFYNWSMVNGYCKGLSIDRIDVNGNYEPSNCRWATPKQQCNNTRRNIYITYNGKTQTLMQWAEELNLTYSCVQHRYERGWSIKEILLGRQNA